MGRNLLLYPPQTRPIDQDNNMKGRVGAFAVMGGFIVIMMVVLITIFLGSAIVVASSEYEVSHLLMW